MAKVSIVVPVYKTEKYLKRCLKSLTGQTLRDIEIILVDDGSPDNCPLLCDKAQLEDCRIKVIHKENGGLGFARNSGLEAAEGEYVGFVDSDDSVSCDMFEKLYNAAKKYDADLIMSGMSFAGGNMFGKENEYVKNELFEKDTLFETEADRKKLMLGIAGALPGEERDSRYGMSVCKNIYRKSVLDKHNIKFLSEREILSEDAIFMLDFASVIKMCAGIPGSYYNYYRNEESLSKSYNPSRIEKCAVFIDEVEKRLSESIPEDEYKIYTDRLSQAFGRVLCSQEIVYAAENKIGLAALRQTLKKICIQEKIKNSLAHYPWYKLPPKQALFAFLIKYRLYLFQVIAVRIRMR